MDVFSLRNRVIEHYSDYIQSFPDGWPKGNRGRVKKTKARNLAERFD